KAAKAAQVNRQHGVRQASRAGQVRAWEQILDKILQKQYRERMAAWRRKMQEMKAPTYQWVKGQGHKSTDAALKRKEEWLSGPAAVDELRAHYEKHFAWAGHGTDVEGYLKTFAGELEDMQAMIEHAAGWAPPDIASAAEDGRWSAPTAADMRRSLHSMRKTAAGLDGWQAAELEVLPDAALQELIEILGQAELQGWPPELQQWRQVHLPKTDPPELEKMRPVSIASTVLRMWTRYRASQLEAFLRPAFSEAQAGGLRGRRLEELLDPILEQMEATANELEGGWRELHGRTWDFQSAFDTVEPQLVQQIWVTLGVPAWLAEGVASTWKTQTKVVEFGGYVAKDRIVVQHSMPQGCPCAMLGMATVMAAPVWRAKRAAPDAILSVYADDRAAVGMTEHQIDRIEEAWAALEACTSMRTHRGKTQSFCMVQGAIWDMTRIDQVRLLGVEILIGASAGLTVREQTKIEEGDQWRSGARPLQQLLLVGHTADFSLRLLDRIWTLMDARIRRRGAAYVEDAFRQFWMQDKRTAGVMQAVDAAMRKLGFLMMLDDQDHVIWKAPPEADGAEISLTCPKDARDHLIREVWRKRLWATFLGSRTRRDSAAGRHAQAPYCPRAIRAALELTKASDHEIAILTGAFFSNARLAKIKGLPIPKCLGCDLDEVDDAAHTFWRCPRFAQWRRFVAIPPNPEWPVWPTRLLRGKREVEEFKQRIHYMASVRQCILHQRHRRTDAEGEQQKAAV
ncbi:unnamed protein product, partial [Prorocentrum cordatum]